MQRLLLCEVQGVNHRGSARRLELHKHAVKAVGAGVAANSVGNVLAAFALVNELEASGGILGEKVFDDDFGLGGIVALLVAVETNLNRGSQVLR